MTGNYSSPSLTPDEHVKLVSWRPPRHEEIDLSYGPCTDMLLASILTLCVAKKYLDGVVLKESWIRAMMLRLVRDQLNACYKDNGVNHYDNCAHLSELYLKWMREGYRVRGGKLRMKIDQKQLLRREFAARPPPEAPVSRPYDGIYNEKKYEKSKNGNGNGDGK